MNRKTFCIGVAAALLAAGGASAQFSINDIIVQPPGLKFQIDQFEQNIKDALDGEAVGYAYAISQNGQLKKSGAGGFARTSVDVPAEVEPIAQSPSKRMNIASITKPITATLVHKLIQDKMVPGYPNLTLNSPIGPFLPSSWLKGPGVGTLTFAELLSQYTGMFDNKGATGTSDLEEWVKKGVTRPKTQYIYINANIAIFRIIIPYMMLNSYGRTNLNNLEKSDFSEFSKYCGDFYKAAVRSILFQPIGIQNADMKNTDPVPTLLYSTDPREAGLLNGDWTEVGAGGGWFLSAIDLARFFAHLRYNNNILTPETRLKMNDLSKCPGPACRMLGWQRPYLGEYGYYYYHSGSLTYGAKEDPTKSGMRGVVMNFPNNVQAVLLVNSIGTYEFITNLMADAYDMAWE